MTDPESKTLEEGRIIPLADALRARHRMNTSIRGFFDGRDFLEVETPNWVEAPGTDVHLHVFGADYEEPDTGTRRRGYLHTSPEFAMKRLLVAGLERIYQLCKVWRNGEVSGWHNPEFTILEWYRAHADVAEIMADVEALTCEVLDEAVEVSSPAGDSGHTVHIEAPFERMTMQELVEAACGFDILQALDFDSLRAACDARDLLSDYALERADKTRQWDELFFALQISHIDPYLADLGPVFVTEWPAPLAVLARNKPEDERVAERFELYVAGVELANGFQELCDPAEQRARFEQDLAHRRRLGLPELPMPERFLAALEQGMPPSSGVAMGVDRLLMLQLGVSDIGEVAPFALRREETSGTPRWT